MATIKVAQLALAASLLTLVFSIDAQAVDVGIVSNNTDIWSVSETHLDSMGKPVTTDLGKPQHVCLNAPSNPPSCPTGATPYGYTLPAWTASLSNLPPNAAWIWANKQPNGTPITGATTGAANAEFSFKARFFLCGNQPQDGTIWVAADTDTGVSNAM